MLTSVTHVILCFSCLILKYGYSAAIETNNLSIYVNASSRSAQLSLKGFMLRNATRITITLYKFPCNDSELCKLNETHLDRFDGPFEWKKLFPKTNYSVIVEVYIKNQQHPHIQETVFKTRPIRRSSTTPDPWTPRPVVNDVDGKHSSGDWTTDGGHQDQSQAVASQTTYPVTTSSKNRTRSVATSTTELVPFTEVSKSSTEQGRENIEERESSKWDIEEVTQTQRLNTTEIHGPYMTENNGPVATQTHRPVTAETQVPYTRETQGQDTTETHRPDATETQSYHKPHKDELETTQSQPHEITDAAVTTQLITQPRTITSDQAHEKADEEKTPNQDTETPSVNGTVNGAVIPTQRSLAFNGLIWWVAVVGGAGLGIIIVLSILTVLFYRPWRRRNLIQLRNHPKKTKENMYGKIGANRNSKKLRGIHSKNSCYGKISEKECGDDERYQRTQSVFSWGTEFDSFDPIEEVECQPRGDYANNSFMLTQANIEAFNNSVTSSAELLGNSSLCYASSDILNQHTTANSGPQ